MRRRQRRKKWIAKVLKLFLKQMRYKRMHSMKSTGVMFFRFTGLPIYFDDGERREAKREGKQMSYGGCSTVLLLNASQTTVLISAIYKWYYRSKTTIVKNLGIPGKKKTHTASITSMTILQNVVIRAIIAILIYHVGQSTFCRNYFL